MTISKEVRQWAEVSESVADTIDKHLSEYPGFDHAQADGKTVVFHLGTRYTVIAGFIPPDTLLQLLGNKESSDKG